MTELIINHAHLTYYHAGPQLLMAMLQRRFWIIGLKDAVRCQIKKCVVCTRHGQPQLQQIMGDLPSFRVNPARPFLRTGVDYAGPFYLRPFAPRSKFNIKAYMALFVCMTTRAIHLELVSSMTTAAFLLALKRFIGRRGKCSDIYSDCGTNFVGADRELRDLAALVQSSDHQKKVAADLATDGIQWHFNPPAAPHMGGLWEAGVKSAKFHLRRVIGNARLTFEEMATVMTQVEACLNSRPLTPVTADPTDLAVLTPGHFLIGDALTAYPEPDLTDVKENRLTRWQLTQQLFQHFWRRWSREFLTRLQQRPKWLNHRTDIRVGDMVLIRDDHLPPLKWKLARVIKTNPGLDGHVRVVTVKTADGEFERPIVKLCLLPIDPAVQNDESEVIDHL